MAARRRFGSIVKMRSGRYQASYIAPDSTRHYAPTTYRTKGDADRWLVGQEAEITAGRWTADSPLDKTTLRTREAHAAAAALDAEPTFEVYSRNHILTHRHTDGQPLAARTQGEYLQYTERELREFHGRKLSSITEDEIAAWYDRQRKTDNLALLEKSYSYIKSLLTAAVADKKLPSVTENPCRVSGGSVIYSHRAKQNRRKRIKDALVSGQQLDVMVTACEEAYRAAVVIGAWIGLRSEELRELRRKDVTIKRDDRGAAVISFHIERAVTYVAKKELQFIKDNLRSDQTLGEDGYIVGPTKSAAGERRVILPPHANEHIIHHLENFVGPDADALLFRAVKDPTRHLAHSTLWRHWDAARKAALRADVPFHGLRHKSATAYAQVGATMMEVMERHGHNDVTVAMMYQQVGAERDLELVGRMSADHVASAGGKTAPAAPAVEEAQKPKLTETQMPQAELLAAFAEFLDSRGTTSE
ncbi:tyrosine-type recombinase/integrase [Microbacterium sp. M]|uniref:tyrosine-type recombinase/integrase n=1 Tax=Microbacterium sp. M TaxID=3377125 RepID=UPI0038683AEE